MTVFAPIPSDLLPADGRFGSGPSRIRSEQLTALLDSGIMGTSHRQAPVKTVVASIREGLSSLLTIPHGWEVVLGNGGASAFWDVAAASLIRQRSAFATFGEFGAKFATEVTNAPHLEAPQIFEAPAGQLATIDESALNSPIDAAAYPQHETSTGVLSPLYRVGDSSTLTLVDATSIAGAISVDLTACDAYYFSPQKAFGSDGGLWVAILSPEAQKRAHELSHSSDRWIPQFLNLSVALSNSTKNQTLNTPALATLLLMEHQIHWMLNNGGIDAMYQRARAGSDLIYRWADSSLIARPFVSDPALRSPVVATVEFDSAVDVSAFASHMRHHGILDINAYRGVGSNQLRIATWPSTPQEDIEALLACFDYVLEHSL